MSSHLKEAYKVLRILRILRRFKRFYVTLLILYWKLEADPGAGKRLTVLFIGGYWRLEEEQAWPHGGELKIIDDMGVRGADVMR